MASTHSTTSTPAPRSQRQRNKRGEGGELRVELIAAASRLLEDVAGEEALSLRSVARETGVAAPSIYRHFADKHELVDAVLEVRFAELRERLDTAGRATSDPVEELRARALTYCSFALEQPGNYRVMFTTVPVAPETRPLEELPGARIIVDLAGCIGRCATSGKAGPFEPLTASILLWTSLHGIVSLRASKPAFPWPPVEQLVDDALLALCGIPRP
jgi:AcrR family transcriptional regulator